MLRRNLRYALLSLAGGLAVVLGVQAYLGLSQDPQARPQIPGLLWPNPKPIGEFSLTDHRGEAFGLESLKGQWTFLFFGYTNCPDVCPVTLAVMNSVANQLSEEPAKQDNVQFAFVTVDPERDTQEQLAGFISYFNEDFVGVGGPDDKLVDLTRQLGIVFIRSKPEADGSYLVDHTASILLVNPSGELIALFRAPHDPVEMAQRFDRIRELVKS